ncbi:hypothetical protein RGU12_06400 [Fredinandcohnia sp. QZ13]|uniref:hypothetical protein n=1 Tax=Fredinandcohnia sp. QZ13 TaxID=3073144 RepID=UPI00285318AC|nr:hypothetical protein [Fredinandcohnia sp. QZ13]MDR4887186.1 hypothetical protein [Fredinandcohnia sp. QZ13]
MNLTDSFEKLDSLFEGFFEWLAGQYDPITGGFYYAKSSISDSSFTPDIESTAQALNILSRNELLTKMPVELRAKFVSFFQNKQDPETGYFLDENPHMKDDEVMVSRAFNYSVNSLDRLGGSPLYPSPVELNQAPHYVKSEEEYLKKWKSISLVNSWRGCDLLASSCMYIGQMEQEKQEKMIQIAAKYLESIQDPQTGLWGEGSMYVRISGTFKLHTFYHKFGLPMPRVEKMYQSILHCLRTETVKDMCYIRNPIDLLSYINVEIPSHELEEIVQITVNNIEKLKRPDGGFSREIDHSPSAPNVAQVKADEFYPDMPVAVHLGKGLYEGDMNAGTQTTLIRLQLHKLAGKKVIPIKGSRRFYELVENRLQEK